MLSIYISNNLQLIFELVKPSEQLSPRPSVEESLEGNVAAAHEAASSSFRHALKQTKMALLNSFGQMHLLNGHQAGGQEGAAGYCEGASVQLQQLRLPRNKWTHLVFGLQQQADGLQVTIIMDGLEQHTIGLPFHNLRFATRSHSFQMLAVGEALPAKQPGNGSNSSRSTLDGCAPRYALSNVVLFKRRLVERNLMLNLTAMGPDFTEFTQCQVASANWKPNFGYVQLHRLPMATNNFGNPVECMRQLREARVLVFTAQQPDLVMWYDASQELDMASYGQPQGHILYGELLQHQPQTLQTAVLLSGGLSTMLYLFARVRNAKQSMLDFPLNSFLPLRLSSCLVRPAHKLWRWIFYCSWVTRMRSSIRSLCVRITWP